MRLHSVETAVDLGNNRSNQHALAFADAGGIVHDLAIEIESGLHRLRAQRLQFGDVWHRARVAWPDALAAMLETA